MLRFRLPRPRSEHVLKVCAIPFGHRSTVTAAYVEMSLHPESMACQARVGEG